MPVKTRLTFPLDTGKSALTWEEGDEQPRRVEGEWGGFLSCSAVLWPVC